MIKFDKKSNIGFDFDVNIFPQTIKGSDAPAHLRKVIFNAIQKYYKHFSFDSIENSSSVITVKKINRQKNCIEYGCDFALVREKNGRQQIVVLHKKQKNVNCVWENRGDNFDGLPEKEKWLKDNLYWNELRNYYIEKKNYNIDENKHSRSLFAESVNDICRNHGYKN